MRSICQVNKGRAWGRPRPPQLNFYRPVSLILKHRVDRVFFGFYLDPPGAERVPPTHTHTAAVALYALPKIWGCQVSQLIVRFYVRSHATLLTFLKAVVWLKLGREDEATSVDVLQEMRRLAQCFLIFIELAAHALTWKWKWLIGLEAIFFLILIMIN